MTMHHLSSADNMEEKLRFSHLFDMGATSFFLVSEYKFILK